MYLGRHFETVEIPQSERRQKLSKRLQHSDEYVCYVKNFRRTNPLLGSLQRLKLIRQTAIYIKTTSAKITSYEIGDKFATSVLYGENGYKHSAHECMQWRKWRLIASLWRFELDTKSGPLGDWR